jgi:hypothetical protein
MVELSKDTNDADADTIAAMRSMIDTYMNAGNYDEIIESL